jgi:hypothetical protein
MGYLATCQICFKKNMLCTKERLFSDEVGKKLPRVMEVDISKTKADVCENCNKTLTNIKEKKNDTAN